MKIPDEAELAHALAHSFGQEPPRILLESVSFQKEPTPAGDETVLHIMAHCQAGVSFRRYWFRVTPYTIMVAQLHHIGSVYVRTP